MSSEFVTLDGNEAAARVAYALSEVVAIYPITPASPMGEQSDSWANAKIPNLWGDVPRVIEMQSEGGAAGAVHGALQAGALTTTFTASQGLLLMLPNMYKIAGELTPSVIHVAARSLAAQALSIFGDHSDVMSARGTGWTMLASGSVQEAHDLALAAHAASLETRIPVLHFFDGFRTSHEVAKIQALTKAQIRAVVRDEDVAAHRSRALDPERPAIRGTAQNPDVYFQARESVNPFYNDAPARIQAVLDRLAQACGRQYRLFDYHGAPDAERVVVLMGSGAEAAHETVDHLVAQGEKVGMLRVRLYRPFSPRHLLEALPETVKSLAVLDRTKEPGCFGEPLFLDVQASVAQAAREGWLPQKEAPQVVGGRYGLSSKEFTPGMVKAVLDELGAAMPRNGFTVGIRDDVSGTSLDWDADFDVEPEEHYRAVFFGLGSDGTVGANKNTIKILGEETEHSAQAYFVYDSKKSGAQTVSHLRLGKEQIRSTYLIRQADLVACHQESFLERQEMAGMLRPGGIFLLATTKEPDKVWRILPTETRRTLLEKKARLFVVDAAKVAQKAGMGKRINTVMQTCFFALSEIVPRDEAIQCIKDAVVKTYGSKGAKIVSKNHEAIDLALQFLSEVPLPESAGDGPDLRPPVPADAPEFIRTVTGEILAGRGDDLPVSALPCDGTYPVGSSRYQKWNLATEIPSWDPDLCIQCGKCAMVCPHAAIRSKVYDNSLLEGAPSTFLSVESKVKELGPDKSMTIQVAPEDCTGCSLCAIVCPARDKSDASHKALDMTKQAPRLAREIENWDYFRELPEADRTKIKLDTVRGSQLLEPLFEFSGACAGCGETPYVKLLSQLFGDRALVANATGCSSIYGGNLPTTPWSANDEGRGPAWSNSLFEDNAEFGLGMREGVNQQRAMAEALLQELAGEVGEDLATAILTADESSEAGVHEQRERVGELVERMDSMGTNDPRVPRLKSLVSYLLRKSVWIVGGDGWAYDIGYGGLDHVLASGQDVNILVMDTEVYSNTGGQASKATPPGAVAKFAAGGKTTGKKDLGRMAISYGNVYVAQVAFGAKDTQTVKAMLEAESYPGPSLVIAYSHCIAHGYPMQRALEQQELAVKSGHWPLYRYDPRKIESGKPAMKLDGKAPSIPIGKYMAGEGRFRMLELADPGAAADQRAIAQMHIDARYEALQQLATAPGKES